MSRLAQLCCLSWLVLLAGPLYAKPGSDALVFGIVPQQSAEKLLKAWGPVLQHLSEELGQPLRFSTAPTIGEFEERCQQGAYDFAYMNPYHYVRFAQNPGYYVLANQSNKKLKGVFVVHKDADIASLADLDGKIIHLPSPNAFAASLLTQAELQARGIRFRPHFAGSHDSVYLNVARELAVAGGGIVRTFNIQKAAITSQLRILAYTRSYTPHAIAAHPRIDKQLAANITQALLKLPEKMRQRLRFTPLQIARDEDYDDIRALNIETDLGNRK